ncbi:MAG: nuclear transport factor 2 family protein [Geodermatophilaceae bacterium]|jgi:ketosteroid isomerase-like protein|nr:nuclear transport factor 2 family protein [Geodermatophilaceae bacterium]
MAEHRTVELLRQAYDAFDRGDVETVLSMLHEDVVWHIKGLGALDGDYQGPQAVMGFLGQSAAETEGTLKINVHDILGNDEHGVVLATVHASRNGKTLDSQIVHVVHMRDGREEALWTAAEDPAAMLEFWA